jgi:hypothetical protein
MTEKAVNWGWSNPRPCGTWSQWTENLQMQIFDPEHGQGIVQPEEGGWNRRGGTSPNAYLDFSRTFVASPHDTIGTLEIYSLPCALQPQSVVGLV